MKHREPIKSVVAKAKVYLLLETGGGGSGRHVLDLYAGLLAAGWDVHLLLSTLRMDTAFAREVAALPAEHVTHLRVHRSPHISDLMQIVKIRRKLQSNGGNVILHAHSTKAAILVWALRGGLLCRVFTPHAYRGMDPNLTGYRRSTIRAAERLFSKHFESVIAVSHDEVTYTSALGVSTRRIHMIPNGVDVVKIRSVTNARRTERGGDVRVIGFLGRLVEQKNPKLFLQVLRELVQRGQNVKAMVVGDGPLLPALQEFARALGVEDRVGWLGMVPALDQLANMDVLVHTSAYESLPYALLEAIAANVPVVAVGNAGSRAIFAETFPRCIVHESTPDALADAVSAALNDQKLQQEYRNNYSEIMERFSTRSMVNKTILVYEDALRLRSARSKGTPFRRLFPETGFAAGFRSLLHRKVNANPELL